MHEEILTEKQKELLALIKEFSDQFGLVGGTAVALYIGHRRSIDFDLFSLTDFDSDKVRSKIREKFTIERTFVENPNELTLLVNDVKITFYKYPFNIEFSESFLDIIKLPDLITLAAMKAYTLGRRAKWKDYVDLYFIFKTIQFKKITEKARYLFKGEFNEKLFREQLAYFEDIDYSEEVNYLSGFNIEDHIIKEELTKISLE